MERCGKVLIPELNHQGQPADLIGHLCPVEITGLDLTTGTPLPPSLIFERIESLL